MWIDNIMKIKCKHWKDCGVTNGGICTINEYTRPSFGICLNKCTKYDGPDRTKERQELISPTINNKKLRKPCNKTDIRRWMGLRWFGLPAPVRVWRRIVWATHPQPAKWPGCGCLVKIKVAWDGFKWWIKTVKAA